MTLNDPAWGHRWRQHWPPVYIGIWFGRCLLVKSNAVIRVLLRAIVREIFSKNVFWRKKGMYFLSFFIIIQNVIKISTWNLVCTIKGTISRIRVDSFLIIIKIKKIWRHRYGISSPKTALDLHKKWTLQQGLTIDDFVVKKRRTCPSKSASGGPPKTFFKEKKIHENDRNEILGKVTKFQVVISTNEGTAQENPQGGPIRPPPDRNRVKELWNGSQWNGLLCWEMNVFIFLSSEVLKTFSEFRKLACSHGLMTSINQNWHVNLMISTVMWSQVDDPQSINQCFSECSFP